MRNLASLLAAVLLAATAARADPPVTAAPAPAAAPGDTVDALDKIVYRDFAPKTGTLLGHRRVCRTEREWIAEREHAQKDITKMQTNIGIHQ